MDEPILSADGHIDFPLLPENLWRDNAPAALRERMPRVVDTPRGRTWVSDKGAPLGLVGGMGSAGRPSVPGEIPRSDRMAGHRPYRREWPRAMPPANRCLRRA